MQKTRFNIMAVGPNGIGKTTFLKALLQGYANKVNIDGKQNTHLRKQVGEEETLQIVPTGSAELNSENISTIKVYESLGYGDFINNENAIETISSYLVNAHANWRDLDAQSMSQEDFLLRDERIHCLFYFLSPHSLKEIDKEFLKKVSSIVPIIPVIAKADTLTVLERNFFMKEVYNTIDKLSGSFSVPIIYKFHGIGNSSEVMDSAIINTLKDSKNSLIEVDTDSKRAHIINRIMQLIKVNGHKNEDMDPINDSDSPHLLPLDGIPLLTTADAYFIDSGRGLKRSEVGTETTANDTLFNQETFVNIGQALSANSPDSDCISVISKSISSESMDDLVMMNSAVLVDVSQCKSDENHQVSFPINPAERMLCKIVCEKICEQIEGKGKEAVCKLVTSVVCEHVGTDNSNGIEELRGNEEITRLVNDLLATYESDDHNTNRASLTVQDISSLLSAAVPLEDSLELALKGAEAELPSVSPLSTLSSATPAELSRQISSGLKPFSLSTNGVHIYSNIFAIICGSIESNATHDVYQIGGEIGGISSRSGSDENTDGNGLRQMAKEKERLRIYSWGTVDTADDTHSDLNRLKELLFQEGSHIKALIERTRQQSIHLFPTRGQHNSSRTKANHKEKLRDLSNLLGLLDPIPLSSMISIIHSLPSTLSIIAVFSINNLVARLPSTQLIATFSDVKERLISLIRTVVFVLAGTLSMVGYVLAGTLFLVLGPLLLFMNCLCSYILSTAATFHVELAAVWKSVTFFPAYLINNYRSSIIVDKGSCGNIDEIYSADTFSSELNPTYTDMEESDLRILLDKRLSKTSVPLLILNCFESVSAFCDECCTANSTTSPPTPTASPYTNDAVIMDHSPEGPKSIINKGTANNTDVNGEVMIRRDAIKYPLDAWIKFILMVLKVIVIVQIVFLVGSLPIEFMKRHIKATASNESTATTVGHIFPTIIPLQKNFLNIFQPPTVFKISRTDSTKSINIDEKSVAYCLDHHSRYENGAFGCLSYFTDKNDVIVSDLHDCENDLNLSVTEIDCAKAKEEESSSVEGRIHFAEDDATQKLHAKKLHDYLEAGLVNDLEELEELIKGPGSTGETGHTKKLECSTAKEESLVEGKKESDDMYQQNKIKEHKDLLFKKIFRDVKKMFKSMKDSLVEAIELLYYIPLATLVLLSSSTLAIMIAQLPIVAIHIL